MKSSITHVSLGVITLNARFSLHKSGQAIWQIKNNMIIHYSASKEIYQNKLWFTLFELDNSIASSEGARLIIPVRCDGTLYKVQGKRINYLWSPESAKL